MKKSEFLKLSSEYDNIIFDYGGIFIDIDYNLTVQKLGELSQHKDISALYCKEKQLSFFKEFEIGKITSEQFIKEIKNELGLNCQDKEVIQAWNMMLIRYRVERVDFLKEFVNTKRVFLLSNINQIHEDYLIDIIDKTPELKDLYSLFESVYFSHHLGLRKPNANIFEHVLKENNLVKEKTLFIDDSIEHINGAREIGLPTYYLNPANTFIVS